jgi:CBASS immunity sensor of nucleotide second messenger signals
MTDLFFAGPAFLALFLGHRLNATARVQCYERVESGDYVPACLLF